MSKVSGIYLITCRPEGGLPYYYVGQSSNFEKRMSDHLSNLRCGRHVNAKMQSIFNLHREASFSIELLEKCEASQLNAHEQWWIDEVFGHGRAMNIGREATSGMRGRRHTHETRALMSKAAKERPVDLKKIEKMATLNRGRKLSSEDREKRSLAQKGKKKSPESILKMSMAKKGKKLSAEHVRKIAESNRGENHHTFGKKGKAQSHTKPVEGVNVTTGEVVEFVSTIHAEMNGFRSSCISLACNGKLKTHKGYRWRYVTRSS